MRQEHRQGHRQRASRADALDYGLFAVIDPRTKGAINPAVVGQFVCSWTLDDVEQYLTPTDDAPAPARKAMTA
jgi:hypothetical protein